jgi:hypothetical protein
MHKFIFCGLNIVCTHVLCVVCINLLYSIYSDESFLRLNDEIHTRIVFTVGIQRYFNCKLVCVTYCTMYRCSENYFLC